MIIRLARTAERAALRAVHAAAFASASAPGREPAEVTLLDRLYVDDDGLDRLSFVVVDDDQPIGHVQCSRAFVGGWPVVAVGPIGVLPEHQRGGVGHALMHGTIAAADAIGETMIGLLGSTDYYSRFGFVAGTSLGVEPPDPSWGDDFQVRLLTRHDTSIRGTFRYPRAFDGL